jgi:hypothetical protein
VGRSFVTRANNPRSRRSSGLAAVGIAIVLLFAIVGVVTAGSYVANRVSPGSPSPSPAARLTAGQKQASVREVARAQAQATAIVRQAQSAGRTIVTSAGRKAEQKAQAILKSARQKTSLKGTSSSAALATPPPSAGTGPSSSIPTPVYSAAPAATAGPVNLSSLPAAWLVVAYGATFGSGPGTVGGVTVTNRGAKALSGTVKVAYTRGGSAYASFTHLASGQTRSLGLEGASYRGGGYRLLVLVPR